jgi:hypothetical protein
MKNRYGGPLRSLVAEQFHLKIHVDMVDTPAFHSDVIAYPAITIISREARGDAHCPSPSHRPGHADQAGRALRASPLAKDAQPVRELARCHQWCAEPWLLESSDQMALIADWRVSFRLWRKRAARLALALQPGRTRLSSAISSPRCRAGSQAAPGDNSKTSHPARCKWRGQGVINPFAETGGLVDLRDYPRLRRYLEARREVIAVATVRRSLRQLVSHH